MRSVLMSLLMLLLALLLSAPGAGADEAWAPVTAVDAGTKRGAAEVTDENVHAAISKYVEAILKCQRKNGGFILMPTPRNAADEAAYPVGETSLALLALEYARPHLSGTLQTRTQQAIQKAVAFIVQHPLEPETYSAGLALVALYMESPDRYQKTVGDYAWMLAASQHDQGEFSGMWGYRLKKPPGARGPASAAEAWGDYSNAQFALLGLYMASRMRFQTPRAVWERAAESYTRLQSEDGGWGYSNEDRKKPSANMTLASTTGLHLCEEMLYSEPQDQCTPRPRSRAVDAGLKWIADHWEGQKIGKDAYGLYALERLGILMGRANIGGHDWYRDGAASLLNANAPESYMGSPAVSACFAVAFLSRGLEPVVINKLERPGAGDWNNDAYDVKHLVDFLQDHYQQAVQWRIVTLEAPLELLERTPILYISGHEGLDFSDAEKEKLRAYVERGGTILAQACCGEKEFADSFRALVKEIFGEDLKPLPEGHRIFERMKAGESAPKPAVECLALDKGQGRPAVIFLPTDYCCRWHSGGDDAREAFAVGAGIYFYVTVDARKTFPTAYSPHGPKPETIYIPPPTPLPPKPAPPPR